MMPCRERGDHALDRPRPGEIAACEKFWTDARARLGRLYRLTDRDLDEIEALLAKKIPKPVPIAASSPLRPSAHPIRGPHQPVAMSRFERR